MHLFPSAGRREWGTPLSATQNWGWRDAVDNEELARPSCGRVDVNVPRFLVVLLTGVGLARLENPFDDS